MIEIKAQQGVEKGKAEQEAEDVFLELRKSRHMPLFTTEGKGSEQALMTKTFINELFTRRIEWLGKATGMENNVSAWASKVAKELEKQLAAFCTRCLEEEYLFLWVDALYDKARIDGPFV